MAKTRRWKLAVLVAATAAAALSVFALFGRSLESRAVTVATSSLTHATERGLMAAVFEGGPVPHRRLAAREGAPGDPPVTVLAVGDIASCEGNGDEQTAKILSAKPGLPVLTLGDHAYYDGTAAEFRNCFGPSWGPFKSRLRPTPGNHEYHLESNAQPYFDYFGAAAGPAANAKSRGYYSFDLGAWHVIALNSEQDQLAGGAQLAWLRADLAATDKQCLLAFWHRPRFITDTQYSDQTDLQPFWAELSAAGAEIVLNGHSHTYQRYAPMDAAGRPDPAGIREFVVGTGGRAAHKLLPDARRDAEHAAPGFYGVLQLRLNDGSYDWSFIPVAGQSYSDSGSGICR